jgi:hypothetical protein
MGQMAGLEIGAYVLAKAVPYSQARIASKSESSPQEDEVPAVLPAAEVLVRLLARRRTHRPNHRRRSFGV